MNTLLVRDTGIQKESKDSTLQVRVDWKTFVEFRSVCESLDLTVSAALLQLVLLAIEKHKPQQ